MHHQIVAPFQFPCSQAPAEGDPQKGLHLWLMQAVRRGPWRDVQTVAPEMLVRLQGDETPSSGGDCTLVDRSLYAPRQHLDRHKQPP